jgi:hypothetical protein
MGNHQSTDDERESEPTPQQIEERMEAIRQSWSPLARRNRHVMGEWRVRALEPLATETRDRRGAT